MNVKSERLAQSFVSMKQRDFRYLTLSTIALGFAQWFQNIGLAWLVLQVTGSATAMGVVTFLRSMTLLLASLPAGALSDRISRRDMIVWTTAINLLQGAWMAALVAGGGIQPWHLYLFGVIAGIATGISQPSRQAFVYDTVGRDLLTNALTVNSLAQQVSRVTGPPLAGVIIAWLGDASVFFVMAFLNLAAMGMTLLIRPRPRAAPARPQGSMLDSVTAGLRYSVQNRLVLALVVATGIAPILVYPYIQFFPSFARDVLHGGSETYGWLASAGGWGAILGLGTLAFLGDIQHKGRVFILTQFGYVGCLAAFAQSHTLPLCLAFLVVAGMFQSVQGVLGNTLFQLAAPNEMRGRISALNALTAGVQPVGALPMGYAVDHWGAPAAITTFMAMAAVMQSVTFAIFPQLRDTDTALAAQEARNRAASGPEPEPSAAPS